PSGVQALTLNAQAIPPSRRPRALPSGDTVRLTLKSVFNARRRQQGGTLVLPRYCHARREPAGSGGTRREMLHGASLRDDCRCTRWLVISACVSRVQVPSAPPTFVSRYRGL